MIKLLMSFCINIGGHRQQMLIILVDIDYFFEKAFHNPKASACSGCRILQNRMHYTFFFNFGLTAQM